MMISPPDIGPDTRSMHTPNFSFENKVWKKRFKYIAGIDEVGRGGFAGPVVAGAVVFKKGTKIPKEVKINDSKKLTPQKREIAAKWIKENAFSWGIGEVGVPVINKKGMGNATKMAFRRAVNSANGKVQNRIDYLLIDAFYVPYFRGFPSRPKSTRRNGKLFDSKSRQLAIVNGDEKSVSIAAASIIAKVYRDLLMKRLSTKPSYKKYRWNENKGYATKKHQNAIRKYGITKYHRKSFVETWLKKKS